MYIIDQSEYPVVSFMTRGQNTVEDTELYFSTVESLLARQEKFGMVIAVEAADDTNRDSRISNMTAKWIKEARPRIALYCAGIATVAPDQEYRDRYAPLIEGRGLQIYGCPCKMYVVGEEDKARQWLRGQIEAES